MTLTHQRPRTKTPAKAKAKAPTRKPPVKKAAPVKKVPAAIVPVVPEVLTALALADRFADPVSVQPDPAPVVDSWGYQTAKMPSDILIINMRKTTYNTVTITYFDPKTGVRSVRDVQKTYKLKLLTADDRDKMLKEWKVVYSKNLGAFGRRLTCTLGTDPEIFVVDKDNQIIPAWTYLPAKEAPARYNYNAQVGTVYWDGFQAEFTTSGQHTCFSWVSDSVQAGLRTIHEAAQKVGGKLSIRSVIPVNPDFLQDQKPEHVQFGCAPSYNAYGLKGNIQDGRNVPYRFAGGHLHFGIGHLSRAEGAREAAIQKYVKALDKVLGVASVAFLGELDSPIRRAFYGQPGEYRMPSHGFEYRTLSNAWMSHPLAMNMVFDLGRAVCGLAEDGLLDGWEVTEEETIRVITENDVEGARAILDRNKDVFKQVVKVITGAYYTTDAQLELAFKTWRNGISAVVADPTDVVGNWDLNKTWTRHGDGPNKNWGKAHDALARGEKV